MGRGLVRRLSEDLVELPEGGGLLLRLHEDDYDIKDDKDNDKNEDVNYLMILMEIALINEIARRGVGTFITNCFLTKIH